MGRATGDRESRRPSDGHRSRLLRLFEARRLARRAVAATGGGEQRTAVCVDAEEATVACYRESEGRAEACDGVVRAFLECARRA